VESYHAFAELYDRLMDDVDYVCWAKYIDRLLKGRFSAPVRVADIGCGTGSITIELKKIGYDILGVDASEEMLGVAAKKARAAGCKILFARQDMRVLELSEKDAIICTCDVVNYLTGAQLNQFFCAANACLAPGGALLFDLSSSVKLKNTLGNGFFYEDREDVTYFWKNTLNEAKKKVDMELTFFLRQGSAYIRRDEFHTQYIHEEAKVLSDLAACGFWAERYGFLTEQAPEAAEERIQFVCTKKTAL